MCLCKRQTKTCIRIICNARLVVVKNENFQFNGDFQLKDFDRMRKLTLASYFISYAGSLTLLLTTVRIEYDIIQYNGILYLKYITYR